jgi:hypothetical protein
MYTSVIHLFSGMRNGGSAVEEAETTAAKPSPAAGTKQPAKINCDKNDKNSGGQQQRANTKSPPSPAVNGGQQQLQGPLQFIIQRMFYTALFNCRTAAQDRVSWNKARQEHSR